MRSAVASLLPPNFCTINDKNFQLRYTSDRAESGCR
jgi:hypothetical protein